MIKTTDWVDDHHKRTWTSSLCTNAGKRIDFSSFCWYYGNNLQPNMTGWHISARPNFHHTQVGWVLSDVKVAGWDYHSFVASLQLLCFAAKTRGIAVPVDLDAQLSALFSQSQIVQKHSKLWISAGKSRLDAANQPNQDYRNIIEGLQVRVWLLTPIFISTGPNCSCLRWSGSKPNTGTVWSLLFDRSTN